MAYALGKYSYGVCDRCGFRVRYLQMRMEWTGFKVCPECYEPKHPQLEPPYSKPDPEALQNPRPDRLEPTIVFAGAPGDSAFTSDGMTPSTISRELLIDATLGTVTVVIS